MSRTIAKKVLLLTVILLAVGLSGCRQNPVNGAGELEVERENSESRPAADREGIKEDSGHIELKYQGNLDLTYASQFQADFYEGGYSLITIGGTDRYVLLPETGDEGLCRKTFPDAVLIRQPKGNIYLAASSAMDFFRKLELLPMVTMTSTKKEDWSIPQIAQLVAADEITYVGKYSAPDYEWILDDGCTLAIESTMIYHSPEVKEQLELLGIPVLVERSSYEPDPMGRMEWVKFYGLLCGRLEEAQKFFEEEDNRLREVIEHLPQHSEEERPSTAFFYITSNGAVSVRKPGDYMAKMIALAGGKYLFSDLGTEETSASASMTLQMESFYERAVDADVLIYNSTIDGELYTTEDLLQKSPLFADFLAVQEGNVWCTNQNMFQQTTGIGEMIGELSQVLAGGEADDLQFLHKVQ